MGFFILKTKIYLTETVLTGRSHLSGHFRYHRLIEEYSDVIVGQFFGHQNTDTFRVFYNKKSKCSGSTTSWQLLAAPGSHKTLDTANTQRYYSLNKGIRSKNKLWNIPDFRPFHNI